MWETLHVHCLWAQSPLASGHSGPVYCLVSAEELLLSGGQDGIKGWKWNDLTKSNSKNNIEPVVTLTPPSTQVTIQHMYTYIKIIV